MPSVGSATLGAALAHPATLRFNILGFLTIGSMVTYALSGPLMLKQAGFSSGAIGTLVAVGGVLGAAGMLLTGWMSDRRGERFTTMWISTTLLGLSFAVTAAATSPTATAVGYLLYGLSWGSVTLSQVSAWPDVLHGKVLALACAAINSLSQAGAFLMPVLWGRIADATGGYYAGLIALTASTAVALLMAPSWQVTCGELFAFCKRNLPTLAMSGMRRKPTSVPVLTPSRQSPTRALRPAVAACRAG